MNKPIIAIDVDDVLADNAAGFVEYSNQKWGTTLKVSDYDEHWARVWNLEHDLVETTRRRDEFVTSGVHRDFKHIDQAYEVLQRLSKNYELRIVTSRLQVMRDDTIDWLHERYEGIFSDDTVHLAGIWDTLTHTSFTMTKADTVKMIGASYLIDDQLKHCEGVAGNGMKAVLFGDYGWNRSDNLPDNIVRAHDWAAVEEYFTHEAGR